MVLVDTDGVVDCLRGTAPAREWLTLTSTETLGLSGVVAMEVLDLMLDDVRRDGEAALAFSR